MRSSLIALTLLLFFWPNSASADVFCIKNSNRVNRGVVQLGNSLLVRPSRCPKGYKILVNTDRFQKEDPINGSRIIANTLSESKLASGVIQRTISVNPFGAELNGGAEFALGAGPGSGIELPQMSPSFAFGFVLPNNYTPNSAIKIKLLWHSSSTSCNINMVISSLSVTRANRTAITGEFNDTGATFSSSFSAPSVANQSVNTDILITSPSTSTTLQGGDAININLTRNGSNMLDTCDNSMIVSGISIDY